MVPKSVPLGSEPVDRQARARRSDPWVRCGEETAGETVGDRIRDKYDRVVREVGNKLSVRATPRGDRKTLLEMLRNDRFLVPDSEARLTLREIARRTKSSYARVAQCDKNYADAVRQRLDGDPEFHALKREARRNPRGADVTIDAQLDASLAEASADEFVRRYRGLDSPTRARMLTQLLDASSEESEPFLQRCVQSLDCRDRERLLLGEAGVAGG
jgi:hypothetical protein